MRTLATWGIGMATVGAHACWFMRYTIDDAYITFTCARNLAHGAGPVCVPGDRVEATSSFLWMVVLAPFEWSGIGSLVGSKIVGLVAALLCVWGAQRLLLTLRPEASDGEVAAAGFAIGMTSPFVLWSVYGMENALAAFLLVLALLLFCRESERGGGWHSAVPIMLLETVRPEGFLFVAAFLVLRLARAFAPGTERRRFLWPWALVLLLPLAGYEVAGYLYYGHVLPNPVAAKIDDHLADRVQRGLFYLTHGRWSIVTYTCCGSLVLASVALLAARPRLNAAAMAAGWLRRFGTLAVVAVIATQLLFIVLVGGDWMPGGRFLSHIAPLSVVMGVLTCSMVLARVRQTPGVTPGVTRVFQSVALMALLGYGAFGAIATIRARHGRVGELQASEDRALGGEVAYLNRHATRSDVVACSDIGRVSYYFTGRVYDWWGLASEEVARTGQALGHIRADTVLRHAPRYIVLYSTAPVLTDAAADYGMAETSRVFLASPEFRSSYRQVYSVQFEDLRYHVIFERLR